MRSSPTIVSWLNLQCYSGGYQNNPGDWTFINCPIVAGTMSDGCNPTDIQNIYHLWVTGIGQPTGICWQGTPNTQPIAIEGGFMWTFSSIKGPDFLAYMNAIKNGLGQ